MKHRVIAFKCNINDIKCAFWYLASKKIFLIYEIVDSTIGRPQLEENTSVGGAS